MIARICEVLYAVITIAVFIAGLIWLALMASA